MAGPWDRYRQQGAAPANPVIAPPDPYKQAAEQRAQVDQSLQLEEAERARRDQQIQEEKLGLERGREERSRTESQRGSVEQNKAAGFLRRAINAERSYRPLGMGPRSYIGQKVAGIDPDFTSAFLNDSDRNSAEQAEREFIAAILRYDSGAAIPPEEFVTNGQIYFPRPGDRPEQIEQKRRAREVAIQGLLQSSGPAGTVTLEEIGGLTFDTPGGSGEPSDGVREGYFDGGLEGRVTDDSPQSPIALGPDGKPRVTGNDPGYAQFAAGLGDIVQGGLNNTVGLLANPINTVMFRGAGYDGYTSDIGATAREALGLPYGNETIGAINQAAAGGFGAAVGARALGAVANSGIARNALLEYGARPGLDMVTGGTAAASGELARQAGVGPVGQAAAILAGGATPSALMGGRNALMNIGRGGGSPPPDFDPSIVRAGERQNIPIRQPDAIPSRRGDTAALETSARGGPVIQQARANDNALIEQRVEQVGGQGSASDPYALGGRVQASGRGYIDRTKTDKDARYLRVDRLSNNQRVAPEGALSTVNRHIAELEAQGENTNQSLLTYLRGLRDDLSKPDGFSVTEFQGLRSGSSKKIKGDQALTATDADRRLGEVVQAFTADASEQLPEAAVSALADADQFYAQRQNFINEVLRPLMGTKAQPVPAERAAERLVAMTKGRGDYERFSRMWGELGESERGDVAATIAMSLGRKANGEFSPATLIRSLDPRTGINPRTARLIFGADGARALADLRTIAQAKTATATALNNSRTGTVVNRVGGGLKTLLMSALGFQAGGIGGAVAGGLAREVFAKWGEERAARALMNPTFTRWLREAPEATNPQAINAYFKRLEVQAAKSPILAQDVRGLQEALSEAFGRSPGRLAAQDQERN